MLMNQVFPTEQLMSACRENLSMTMHDFFEGCLWYTYLDELFSDQMIHKPLPTAKKTHVVFGKDLETLDKLLQSEYQVHLN